MSDERHDDRDYSVVVNEEEQYSIWLLDRPVPAGWRREGTTGSRSDCLAHIEEIWTDMRPLSLRRRMQAHNGTAT
ncbi:MbtH family NRPS accessory protein [Streptomyces sp. NPDC051172]|uniref:MbtH family protein n=1 Tax=Streptomyces sp. NPDC051172 TaxID=3155796 RepID=UPI0034130B42